MNDRAQARADALARLAEIRRQRAELDRAELQAVADARAAGAQWTEIGAAVGMLRQHASRKFRPLLDEQRVVRVRQTDQEE